MAEWKMAVLNLGSEGCQITTCVFRSLQLDGRPLNSRVIEDALPMPMLDVTLFLDPEGRSGIIPDSAGHESSSLI